MRLITPPLDHPGYVAGRWYFPDFVGIASTVAVGAVDIVYFNLVRVFSPILVKGLVCRTGTGGAGSSVKMGVWANSPVSVRALGAPLIADNTGQATTGNSTNVEADTADTWLGRGWYWTGAKFTGTLPTMLAVPGTAPNHAMRAGATTNALLTFVTGVTFADAYSNNLPTLSEGASFSQSTTGNHPLVGFKL